MQHMSPDLGQEEFGVYKLGNPSAISQSRASFGKIFIVSSQLMFFLIVVVPDLYGHSARFD